MWVDIVDLHRFYASGLGEVAGECIRRHIRQIWPDVRGLSLLSLGYAEPYLNQFSGEAECLLAGMPAGQGAFCRSATECARAVGAAFLTDEANLPLPDRSIDRLLLIHCLEASEQTNAMLREVWRVLTDGGRLLAVVPNRRSLWAQIERTPFANGSPYSQGQLQRLLHENMFTLERMASTLFFPPFGQGSLLKTSAILDTPGSRWLPGLGGVLLADATKQIYGATPVGAGSSRRRSYLPVPHNFQPPK